MTGKSARHAAPRLPGRRTACCAAQSAAECLVPDAPFDRTGPLAQELLELTARITARADEDPFGNPVLLVALAISRRIEAGTLDDADDRRADRASARRRVRRSGAAASRTMLAAPMSAHVARLKELAQRLLRPDPNDSPVRWAEYRALVERTRFAAVFTAHPTFALRPRSRSPGGDGQRAAARGAWLASARRRSRWRTSSTRPPRPSRIGRDAIDRFNAALLLSRAVPGRIAGPSSTRARSILSSWVGYDTDGRTDIGWWDTLRLRLEMKRLQLATFACPGRRAAIDERWPRASPRHSTLSANSSHLCPDAPEPPRVAAFAHALVERREHGADIAAAAAAAVRRRRLQRRGRRGAAGALRRAGGPGVAWAGARAHARAAQRGADPQRGAPAAGHCRRTRGSRASTRAVRRDERGAWTR